MTGAETMKKSGRKLISALSLLLAALLTACGTAESAATAGETDTAPTITTEALTDTVTDAETEPLPEKWDGPHVMSLKIGGVDISEYRVVKSSENDATLTTASDELIKYIEAATGVYLDEEGERREHEICVGVTDRDTDRVRAEREKLTNDGCAIIYDEGRLYLTGNTPTGTMYAVYTFLEDHVGCRFYSSRCEAIKYSRQIDVPADICYTHSPKFLNRDTFWYDTFSPSIAAKLKINGSINRNMTNGHGTSITYAGYFVHTLPSLAGTSTTPNVQPCLTDPAVYDKVLANVKKLLRANPDAKIISVSQNDSYANGLGCQCENCKKLDDEQGTPMGSLLTFVNRIANEIKDEFPDVYVDTLAYRYTRKAPKTLKPADNVIIRLCSIECCFGHPLDDPDCPANKQFREDIEAWSKICDNLFVWDYTTDFMYYVNPFPNLGVLYDNVRFYAEHNVIGLFEQGNGQSFSGEFGELRAYLLAKLMWDPDMTREQYYAYMDDFLEGYYGEGWQYIREYIDRTTEKTKDGHMGIYDPINTVFTFKGSKRQKELLAFLEEMKALWDKAYEATDDDACRRNVEKSSLQVLSAMLYCKWDKKNSPAMLETLHTLMKKYRVNFFRENQKTPDTVDYTKNISTW